MSIMVKIRRGEGPFWQWLKQSVRVMLQLHIPVAGWPRPFFAALYHLHVSFREGLLWLLRFAWFEPLFRSQCAAVGTNFQMEQLPYITGRGRIVIGNGVRLSGKPSIGFSNRSYATPGLTIGDHSFIGHECSFQVASAITIGRHCLLAGRVRVQDFDGHPLDADLRRASLPTPAEGIRAVVIGNDVWIGAGAVILKGVTIGDRTIVGASAVVARDVPADAVVVGNPARLVGRLAADESPA